MKRTFHLYLCIYLNSYWNCETSKREGGKRRFPDPDHGVHGGRVLLFFQSSFLVHQHLCWYLGNSILISVTSTYEGLFCCLGYFYCWLVDFCRAIFLPGSLLFLKSTRLLPVSEPQPTGRNFYTPSLNQNFSLFQGFK